MNEDEKLRPEERAAIRHFLNGGSQLVATVTAGTSVPRETEVFIWRVRWRSEHEWEESLWFCKHCGAPHHNLNQTQCKRLLMGEWQGAECEHCTQAATLICRNDNRLEPKSEFELKLAMKSINVLRGYSG